MMPAKQTPNADAIKDFVRRVERACYDLPDSQRRRLVADLELHLREMAGRGDLLAELGDPVQYAGDLRAAMDLPGPTSTATTWRGWRVLLITLVAVGVAVGAVLAVKTATNSAKPSSPTLSLGPATQPITTPATARPVVTVPVLVGLTQTHAAARAQALGFNVVIGQLKSTSAPKGLVVEQSPAAYTLVPSGTTLMLRVSTGP